MLTDPSHQILQIAQVTGGVCTRAGLLAQAVHPSAIDRRLRSGFLQRLTSGVYVVDGMWSTTSAQWAAVLAVPEAAISHHTAGAHYDMPLGRQPAHRVHIVSHHGTGRVRMTLAPTSSSAPTLVVVHEARRLLAHDLAADDLNRPITTRERTTLDLAGHLGPKRLAHVIDHQVSTGRLEVSALRACVVANSRPGVRGIGRLRLLLAERYGDTPRTASELEAIVLQHLVGRRISGFSTQFKPPWFDGHRGVVDFARPDACLIIEADGRRWHQSRAAMESDRKRDLVASSHGWAVLRVTWDQMVHRPDETFDLVERSLAARLASSSA